MSETNNTMSAKGACLCGAVAVQAQLMNKDVGVCHCSMCRQWGGGPFFGVDCQTEVSFTGDDNIGVFSSSDWAERGFCQRCGTHLFYKLKPTGQYIMAAGVFGEDHQLVLDHQVFIDEKPDYYAFSKDTKNLTGAELFAMFSDESDNK